MTFNELQEQIFQNKIKRGFNTKDIGKEIILMTEELGELAKAYKNSDKKSAQEINNKEEIIDAVGDLMVYCFGLFAMMGVNGHDIVTNIVNKNETRTHTGQI